jgi:hypothetical protein
MERNTFNILFYLRRSKLLKDGTVPIFMRITINGKRWDSSLQLGVDLSNWDMKKERTIGNDEGSDTINNKIESLKFRLHRIKTNIEEEGKTMTIGLVKTKFLGQEKLQRTIIQLFESHNDECKKKVGVKITKATHVKYVTCLKHTQAFLRKVYKVDDLLISEIDKEFYEKFEFFLLTDKKCAHNSTIKYILNFNKIVKIAVEKGWLSKSPYREMGYRLEFLGFSFYCIDGVTRIRVHPKSFKRLKARLKELTGRSTGISMEARVDKLNQTIQGWVNYYKLANIHKHCQTTDEWLRCRLRMCYWKQWKKIGAKHDNLVRLGISISKAWEYANTR